MGDEINKADARARGSRNLLSTFGLVEAAGALVCVMTLAGFLGGWFWMFELTSHFRVQYAVLLGLASVILFAKRKWRPALLFNGFAAINAVLLLPFLFASTDPTTHIDKSIRLLAWNVNSQNPRYEELTRLISEYEPDLVLAMEVDPLWTRHLGGLTNFSHQHNIPRDDNFGIALIGRSGSTSSETLHLGQVGVPSINTALTLNGQRLSILSTHPLPPAGLQYSRMRNEQLDRIADWVAGQTNPVVVVGDLNITPWSPVFTRFMDRTELSNSATGRGLNGTWPAGFPVMRIPIDHFLHSTNIIVTRREVLQAKGSDHLPLLIEFSVR